MHNFAAKSLKRKKMQPTLLILAAGIGSRYGGLKQVDGMGPGGEAILDYSVFDAQRAGFGKIVFVIRKDIEKDFREKVGRRIEAVAPVEYAFQEQNTALDWLPEPPKREKPWGTAHAILSAKQFLNEPFCAINADDFYGEDAFKTIGNFLANDCTPTLYGMVAYNLGNTLSENGSVARGVCAVSGEGFLTDVVERTKIERLEKGIYFFEGEKRTRLAAKTPVSMNFWGLHPTVLGEIESQFRAFVEANLNAPKAEFYIPLVINNLIKSGKINLKVLRSDSQWYGVTYAADKEIVQSALQGFCAKGVYPSPLWG